jgi:hypothetical protein
VRAPKGAEDLVTPRVTHGTIKFLLATTGSLLSFLGLRSTITFSSYGCEMTCKDPTTGVFDLLKFNAEHCTWGEDKENCPQSGPEMFIFWILGVLLIVLASTVLGSKYGRKFVIAITNSISKSVGIEYKMHQDTLVVKAWHTPTPGVRGVPGDMSGVGKLLTSLANLRAQFLALTDPEMQKDLRNLGTWKKKDTYAMFYGEIMRNRDVLSCHHFRYTGISLPITRASVSFLSLTQLFDTLLVLICAIWTQVTSTTTAWCGPSSSCSRMSSLECCSQHAMFPCAPSLALVGRPITKCQHLSSIPLVRCRLSPECTCLSSSSWSSPTPTWTSSTATRWPSSRCSR